MRIRGFTIPGIIEEIKKISGLDITWKDPGAYLRVYISISHLNVSGFVNFLIDTGASEMIINQGDIEKTLKIEYENLSPVPSNAWEMGLGGRIETYHIPIAKVYFPKEKGGLYYPFELKRIPVLRHDDKPNEIRERLKNSPSLIGLDLLKKFALSLFINVNDEFVLLTDEVKRI